MSLPWYDYNPDDNDDEIPDEMEYLRIGLAVYQQLLAGHEAEPFELDEAIFSEKPNLKQIQIYLPAVSKIEDQVFYNCPQLEKVEFLMKSPREEGDDHQDQEEEEHNDPPSQLISIEGNSFENCQNLHSIIGLEDAAESLESIGRGAFSECKSLVHVNFLPRLTRLASLGEMAFYYDKTLTNVDLSKAVHLTEIGDGTFHYCASVKIIHLPPNLLRIWGVAFRYCETLEHINLPSKLQHIGPRAFEFCSKVKVIVLPASLQQIGQGCFWNCATLNHVALPSLSMPFMTKQPFSDSCTSLSSLKLPSLIPCQQWPLILGEFCRGDGIAGLLTGGIESPKNRNTIVWNFLRQNMAQLFMEDNAVMSRRRLAPSSVSHT